MKLWAPSLENKAIGCADIDRVLLGIFRLHGTQQILSNLVTSLSDTHTEMQTSV
jgi:hypothetical protein